MNNIKQKIPSFFFFFLSFLSLSPSIFSSYLPTQSDKNSTGRCKRLESISAKGFNDNSGTNLPPGRPMWLIRMTEAPFSRTYFIVGIPLFFIVGGKGEGGRGREREKELIKKEGKVV